MRMWERCCVMLRHKLHETETQGKFVAYLSHEHSKKRKKIAGNPRFYWVPGFQFRAPYGIRTRGLHLGKVALYQLSYYRI